MTKLENYLQEYADYLIALERLHNKDDKIISSEKIRDKLVYNINKK